MRQSSVLVGGEQLVSPPIKLKVNWDHAHYPKITFVDETFHIIA
jgi:hypothetical protein